MLMRCPQCGGEFNGVGARKFCSQECKKNAVRERAGTKEKGVCLECGEEFEFRSNRQIYCSDKCFGAANRRKNHDTLYGNAMRHHDKKMFGGNREIALTRDGHKCAKCGSTEQIAVHHKDHSGKKENPNHSLDNLITLCNHCHALEHTEDRDAKRRTAFLTTCQQCGNLFKTTPYRQSIGSGKYCSKECSDAGHVKLDDLSKLAKASRPNWFKVICSCCGVEFEVPPHRIASGKALYCSRSCRATVENHKRAKPKPEKPIKPIPKDGYKFCLKCGEELLATEEFFYKRTDNGVTKLKSTCKKCTSLIESTNYVANREAIRERQRKSYDKNRDEINARNREKYQSGGKETKSAYYEANKDVIREKALHRREANREKIREIAREYSSRPEVKKRRAEQRKANPEKYRNQYNGYYHGKGKERIIAIGKRREARKKKAIATLTPEQWLETLESFDNYCVYCGEKLDNPQQDHVIPVSAGGGYTKKNMLPACKPCNSSKHNHSLEEWYTPSQPFFSPERLAKIHKWIGFNEKTNTQQLDMF